MIVLQIKPKIYSAFDKYAFTKEILRDYYFVYYLNQFYINLIDDPNTEYKDGMFYMSEDQAKAILELQLHRLTGLERDKIHNDLTELGAVIKDLLAILGSHERIVQIIREETTAVRDNWAQPRRSEISDAEIDIDIEDLIKEETNVITMTYLGYIKRMSLDNFKAQKGDI